MRKLIFILLAFLAVFTYIRSSDKVEAGEIPSENQASAVVKTAETAPIEIVH
jgi:hypothetical protein